MKNMVIALSFLCFAVITLAQDRPKLSILQKQLSTSRPDTGRINVLLQLAEFEILKTGEYKTDLDSAADFIDRAGQLNRTLLSPDAAGYIIIERSLLAREHHNDKAGKILIEEAVKQLSATGNKYLLGKAYQRSSDYYNYLKADELPQKMAALQKAADLYYGAGYLEHSAFCYKNIAELEPDPDTALKTLDKALRLYKIIHYKKLQSVYDLYAQQYMDKSDLKKALQYDLDALRTEQELHDHDNTLVEIENHIGIIYSYLHDMQNQIRFYKMAAADARANGDVSNMVIITLNIVYTYLVLEQPLKAREVLLTLSGNDISQASPNTLIIYYRCQLMDHVLLKNFDRAGQAGFDLIRALKNDQVDQQNKIYGYYELFKYYLAIKAYNSARQYLLMGDRLTKTLPSLDNLKKANGYWFRLDTSQHNYKAAVYHAILQKKFSDSIYQINRSKEMQELQVRFDTRAKEDQIKFLEQKAVLEAQNLQQANIVKDHTIAAIILLIIIAGLLYRQNLIKQRSSKVISDKNTLLQQLLDEKEWLLKEVHHRVKNNLHTVICLLESQAVYLKNDALKAIEDSRRRIYAMSLIHQKLYLSADIKVINMNLYLTEFVAYLKESFGAPDHINVVLEAENLMLGAGQAIPIGLIVNEVVNNSFKYAFPGQKEGEIKIILKRAGDEILLSITDNGTGFEQHADQELNTLGLALIKGLTHDLHGKIFLDTNNGVSINIHFMIDRAGLVFNETAIAF